MASIFILIIYFGICSFIGKLIEFTYYSLKKELDRFKKSGFLYGPFSPIYGIGGLLIYFYSIYSKDFPIILNLIVYFFIPIGIEYTGACLLQKIFNLRLWDYSKYKFNVKGRICLWISVTWFALAILFAFLIQPFLFDLLNETPKIIIICWAVIFSVYFLIDFFISAKRHFTRNEKI